MYYAVFRINNKQKWINLKIPVKGNNKRKAEQKLQQILSEYSKQEGNINDMFFCEYLDMWIEQIKPLIKPSTWEGYEKVVNGKIKPYFKNKRYKLRDLKGMHFTEFFVHLKEHGKSTGTGGLGKKSISNIRGVLSSAFKYAVENDLIHENIIERSRMPVFTTKPFTPTVYTTQQIKKLLEYAEKTESPVCLILYLEMCTGARKGEILGLTWDNVNFDNNTIFLCQNRTGNRKETLSKLTTPKTQNGIRTLPLPQRVIDMLKAEKKNQEKNKKLLPGYYITYEYDYVIRKKDGSTYNPNSINRIINKMTEKIGLPHCRFHDFRHAVASTLFENGVSLPDVTTQLGHGQTSTTERLYIHKNNIAKVENMQTLSSALGI